MPVPASSMTVNAMIAKSAQMTAPKEAKKNRSGCLFAECADEHREDRAACRGTAHGAKDDGKIQRNRSAMKYLQLIG